MNRFGLNARFFALGLLGIACNFVTAKALAGAPEPLVAHTTNEFAVRNQPLVPLDHFVLSLTTPPGTQITIDGQVYSGQDRIELIGLKPGRIYGKALTARFPDNTTAQRTLLVRGGGRAHLVLTSKDAGKPGLVMQTGHSRGLDCMAVSRDGRFLLTGSTRDRQAILWDIATGRQLRTFQAHIENPLRIAVNFTDIGFSADGTLALTVLDVAMLWETASGKRLHTFACQLGVECAALSPDNRLIATGTIDSSANTVIWDAKTGRRIRQWKAHADPVAHVRFSPDGEKLLTCSRDKTAAIWNVASGEKLVSLQGHAEWVESGEFSPDGHLVITADHAGKAFLWDANTGEQIRSFASVKYGGTQVVAFSPNSRQLVVCSPEHKAVRYDLPTGRKIRTLGSEHVEADAVAFSADGSAVFIASWRAPATLWNVQSGELVRTFEGHTSQINSATWKFDGTQILSGSEVGCANLWDLDQGKPIQFLRGHTSAVESVAFTPDGVAVLTGSHRLACLWDAATGQKRSSFHGQGRAGAGFSPDGRRFWTAGGDALAIWDTASGRRVRTMIANLDLKFTAISGDGRRALTVSELDREFLEVTTWEVETGHRLMSSLQRMNFWNGATNIAQNLFALTPDGSYLAAVRQAKPGGDELILINADTGAVSRAFSESLQRVLFLAVSPDGKRLIAGGRQGNHGAAGIWDLSTGKKLQSFVSNWENVTSLAISPSGDKVLLFGGDQADEIGAVLWDIKTGRKLWSRDIVGKSLAQAVWCPDQRSFLTVSHQLGEPSIITIWDINTGKRKTALRGNRGQVTGLSFTPDGRELCTGGRTLNKDHDWDGELILWDLESGQLLRRLADIPFEVSHVALHPDNRLLLVSCANDSAMILDMTADRNHWSLSGMSGYILSVAFSPDGRTVGTAGGDYSRPGECILWDADGTRVQSLRGHAGRIKSLEFSRDGRWLLTGGGGRYGGNLNDNINGKAILWDASNWTQLRSFSGEDPAETLAALSSDNKTALIAASWRASFRDLASGDKQVRLEAHSGGMAFEGIQAVAFSPNGRYLATAGGSNGHPGEIMLWHVATGIKVRSFYGHTNQVQALAFSPDSRQLLSGGWDQKAILWEVATGEKLYTFTGSAYVVLAVAFSPDGKRIATGSGRNEKFGETLVWDVSSGQIERRLGSHRDFVAGLAFSFDGRKLLSASWDKTAILWDVDSGATIRTFEDLPTELQSCSAALSPDSRQVLIGGGSNAVLLDATTGETILTLKGHNDPISSVAFSPDGTKALTGSRDQTMILWDLKTGNRIHTYSGYPQWVNAVAFSPDGRYAVSGSADGIAVMWNTDDGKQAKTFQGHAGNIVAAAWSGDGRLVATASVDRSAILWDAVNGRLLRVCRGHTAPVNTVAFSPNNTTLLTGSTDGTLRLWDVATGDELCRLINLKTGVDWALVTPDGLFDGSAGGREQVCFRVGDGLQVVPLDRFFQDYYYPGLLAALWRGERPVPGQPLTHIAAPVVRVLANSQGKTADREITLEISVTDQGGGIKGPWIRHNNAVVQAESNFVQEGKTSHGRIRVQLVSGANRIEVRAATADGVQESEPAIVNVEFHGQLPPTTVYVVAAGIDNYGPRSGIPKLRYCVQDARALADVFKAEANGIYESVNVRTLLNEQADRAGILDAVADISKTAQPQDTLVMYFACHGITLGQRFFLVPHDVNVVGQDLAEAIRHQGLSIDELGEALGKVAALRRVLIFDTCQSGSVIPLAGKQQNPFAFRGAIDRVGRAQGVFTLAAAAANEDAGESGKVGHGLLTYTLLAGIGAVKEGPLARMPAARQTDKVDVMDWFRFAKRNLPGLAKQAEHLTQNVEMSGEDQPSFPILSFR